MATSGSVDFTINRTELIEAALRLAGLLDPGVSASAKQNTQSVQTLQIYLKHLISRGPNLWRQEEGVLFLDEDTQSYSLGPSGGEATKLSDLVSTTVDGAHSATDTTILLDSITGMASGDRIGIELADGTRQWTTINGAPASLTVTLTTALTGDVDDGATVYTYTSKIERPVRITSIRRVHSDIEVPIALVSREEYFQLPNKDSAGKVVQAYYHPTLTNGKLYVWPTADDVDDQIRFSYERSFEDMDATSNNLDLPVEWIETVKYGLAYRLAQEMSGSYQRISMLKAEAENRESQLLAFDQEYASVYLAPG